MLNRLQSLPGDPESNGGGIESHSQQKVSLDINYKGNLYETNFRTNLGELRLKEL